ncbi:Oidioi.mRNA.OKI2018_I69.chr2.g4772.t1.cds [Oikopleura dioica]|uniref:Oidioi.mRNA.OKI2018_I69.chr2.g4772.t1.cds n=1 Tax=Oikopleura dioica TaxID=34765 RepID=A0ABN7T3W1_OIKDI|nr:Oidioi.mRNA.OKI2018_I69.chr2.g4772.t1.cds [Oikopleura dioica]
MQLKLVQKYSDVAEKGTEVAARVPNAENQRRRLHRVVNRILQQKIAAKRELIGKNEENEQKRRKNEKNSQLSIPAEDSEESDDEYEMISTLCEPVTRKERGNYAIVKLTKNTFLRVEDKEDN